MSFHLRACCLYWHKLTVTTSVVSFRHFQKLPNLTPRFDSELNNRQRRYSWGKIIWCLANFANFTHAGTSEFVTLDDGCRCAELRRPPSSGQPSGAPADHQKIETGYVCRRRIWGHTSANDAVSAKRREKSLFAAKEKWHPGAQDDHCHNQEARRRRPCT